MPGPMPHFSSCQPAESCLLTSITSCRQAAHRSETVPILPGLTAKKPLHEHKSPQAGISRKQYLRAAACMLHNAGRECSAHAVGLPRHTFLHSEEAHCLHWSCVCLTIMCGQVRALAACFWQLGWSSRRHADSALLENFVVSGPCPRRKLREALNRPCTVAKRISLYRRSGSAPAVHPLSLYDWSAGAQAWLLCSCARQYGLRQR